MGGRIGSERARERRAVSYTHLLVCFLKIQNIGADFMERFYSVTIFKNQWIHFDIWFSKSGTLYGSWIRVSDITSSKISCLSVYFVKVLPVVSCTADPVFVDPSESGACRQSAWCCFVNLWALTASFKHLASDIGPVSYTHLLL